MWSLSEPGRPESRQPAFWPRRGSRPSFWNGANTPGPRNISGGVLYGHDLAQILPDFDARNCPIERNIVESRLWFLSKEGGYSLSYRDKIFTQERKHNCFHRGEGQIRSLVCGSRPKSWEPWWLAGPWSRTSCGMSKIGS